MGRRRVGVGGRVLGRGWWVDQTSRQGVDRFNRRRAFNFLFGKAFPINFAL